MTAVVSDRLGSVKVDTDTTTSFASIVVSGGGLGALRFVGFHSMAPKVGEVAEWRQDLAQLSQWCAGSSPAIVAGDFNATLDHSSLRAATTGCLDADTARGAGLNATWPAWTPRWLGVQIDHVFATQGIASETAELRDVPGSDHRAVLTRLRVPR